MSDNILDYNCRLDRKNRQPKVYKNHFFKNTESEIREDDRKEKNKGQVQKLINQNYRMLYAVNGEEGYYSEDELIEN